VCFGVLVDYNTTVREHHMQEVIPCEFIRIVQLLFIFWEALRYRHDLMRAVAPSKR